MRRHGTETGLSLVELLLVLGILGIISAIAIPSFLGQRQRARLIGDAKTNSSVLSMQLEARRADVGVYGSAGKTYAWTKAAPTNSFLPAFAPKGQSQMDFSVAIIASGMGYEITVTDPSKAGSMVYKTNQNGSTLYQVK
jgi:prepilin-type N-terminal cleavage/methylation domain-containing protein